MAQLVIVYWRDIPAQILVHEKRSRTERRKLSERFEQAIDRAAMKAGTVDHESYLAGWRRAEPVEVPGDAVTAADAAVVQLEAEYTPERLRELIENTERSD